MKHSSCAFLGAFPVVYFQIAGKLLIILLTPEFMVIEEAFQREVVVMFKAHFQTIGDTSGCIELKGIIVFMFM